MPNQAYTRPRPGKAYVILQGLPTVDGAAAARAAAAALENGKGAISAQTIVHAVTARQARPRRWPKAMAISLAAVIAAGTAQWSLAQRRDAPRIIVPATIVAEPASQAVLAIQVGPPETLPTSSFVRLRGVPSSVSLTEGHAIAPGAWAIPLFGLATLKAIVPAGVSGRTEIQVSLVGVDGSTLAETRTALVIAAPTPPERFAPEPPPRPVIMAPSPAAAMQRPPPPPPPEMSSEDQARAERMLAQGTRHLEQGNISAARMFFQRAAEAGSALGALRMGSTYDPAELSRTEAMVGITPDRAEARKWYERARDLGAPEAEGRLGRLR